MKLKALFVSCFMLTCVLLSAQQTTVKNIYSTGKYSDIDFPLMIDSLNMKGNKFEAKNMLETFVSLPSEADFKEELKADLSDYVYMSKAQKGARFHWLMFKLTLNKFSKTDVRITGPGMFEAYINGNKESSKVTVEDTLKNAKTLKLNFPAMPGTYTILVKYMSLPSNKSNEGIKITVEPEKKDPDVTYIFSGVGKRAMVIQDILQGTRVTGASISSLGTHALLTLTTTKDDGKTSTEKELINLKTSKKIKLASAVNYRWMPQTNKLYYTTDASGKNAIYTVDPDNLQEELLADRIPSGDFSFLPNETALIYTDKEAAEATKGDLIILSQPEDRQPGYQDKYFLSLFNLQSGVKQRLTYGRHSTYLNDISRDSRYLLFSTREYTPTVRPFSTSTLLKLDLQTSNVDTLWTNRSFVGNARFSTDSKNLVILASAEAFDGIGEDIMDGQISNSYHTLMYIMDVETKKLDVVSKDFKPSVNRVYWSNTDNMIYLSAVDRDYERVFKYDPKQKKFTPLDLNEEVVRGISYASNAAMATYYGVSSANSTRAYSLDMKSMKSNLLSDPSKLRLSEINLSQMKDWSFKASDNTVIEGRYYLPSNFDESKKYPMIVYYYGGTTPVSRTLEYPYPAHVYAAMGYVVYIIQPSGTIGYGQEFAARHVNAWGTRTADDIIEGTQKFIADHPFVNAKKVGCIGASYGGFMTMYLQTRTDIFAAAISHAGISALSSYWGEGYWGYTYSSGASANSYPWNNRELYVNQSPLFSADKINTPLLLLHGMEDTNVPIGESIQMYTALKILGKNVEFIQIKGENHGVANYKRRLEWNYSIFAWFAKWLQDDPSWWNYLYPVK